MYSNLFCHIICTYVGTCVQLFYCLFCINTVAIHVYLSDCFVCASWFSHHERIQHIVGSAEKHLVKHNNETIFFSYKIKKKHNKYKEK